MKTYKIHLIRHGLVQANLDGTYLGQNDVPLIQEGIEELEYLKVSHDYPPVQAVFTSPLARCRQTVSLLYPEAKPLEIPGLTEYDFGEFEGKTAEELKDHDVYREWVSDNADIQVPFGESNAQFMKRVAETFEKIADGVIKAGVMQSAICTHGGVIMAICSMFGLPEAPMHEWLCGNGCGFTLNLIPSVWMQSKKIEVFDTLPDSIRNKQASDFGAYDYSPED